MGKMLAVAAAALLVAAAPDNADAGRLRWLSGNWVSEEGGRWTHENWTVPRGGMMLGVGFSGRGEKVGSWEHMRIAPDEAGVLTFWGSPQGTPPVPFRAVSVKLYEVVFENRQHDFPQRIVYRRGGAGLIATVSAADGSNAKSWHYRRR